jgi:hypothetical protein
MLLSACISDFHGERMLNLKLLGRTLLYLLVTCAVVAIALVIKFISILLGDALVYQIPLIGDALLSLEIMELLNIIVFGILGMGFGVATILLPRYFASRVSGLTLAVLVPLMFSTGTIFKYYNWVQLFSAEENISYNQAELITNSFLRQTTSQQDGFIGYYIYTAKSPSLPVREKEMIELEELERKSKARFARITRLSPEVVGYLYAGRGWVIRLFYFIVSGFSTVVNFKIGKLQVKRS